MLWKCPGLRCRCRGSRRSSVSSVCVSIAKAGDWIAHVHLADSIRWLPGYGHTDFAAAFAALKKIKFDGFMALECRVPGDPAIELPKCAKLLKKAMG